MGIGVLGVPVAVNTQCPVCGGTGVISGLKGVSITQFQYTLVKSQHVNAGCDAAWDSWTYSVNVTISNQTKQTSYGDINFIAAIFSKDLIPTSADTTEVDGSSKEGAITWSQTQTLISTLPGIPIFVTVPAETTRNLIEVLTYQATLGVNDLIQLSIGETVETKCPVCGGKGKISLVDKLRVTVT